MKIRGLLISLILFLAFLTGCANEKYPENVVAVVNGKTITSEEIEQELTERKISIAIRNKLNSLEPNILTPKEVLIQLLNIPEKELNPEQIRYLKSIERATTKLLSNNEAFNILLRKEVIYQEALKHGHEISIDKAKQILEESNIMTNEAVKGDEAALKKQNVIMEHLKQIYKQYGYNSEKDYLNQRIKKTAETMTINRMQSQFEKVIADKLPETDRYQTSIDISNAWNDYGEFLLDKAKIKILNQEYSIELYGNPWIHGLLDLEN